MDDLRRAFGNRLRSLRERREMSQEALAESAGLHWTYISGIERGIRNPGLNILARLAAALDVTLVALVSNLDDKEPRPRRRGRPRRPERQ